MQNEPVKRRAEAHNGSESAAKRRKTHQYQRAPRHDWLSSFAPDWLKKVVTFHMYFESQAPRCTFFWQSNANCNNINWIAIRYHKSTLKGKRKARKKFLLSIILESVPWTTNYLSGTFEATPWLPLKTFFQTSAGTTSGWGWNIGEELSTEHVTVVFLDGVWSCIANELDG